MEQVVAKNAAKISKSFVRGSFVPPLFTLKSANGYYWKQAEGSR
jgi:hypothetical protein